MRGYVAKRRDRFYAVIYEGLDPITGRERRSWHPAGTDRDRAIHLASQLAAEQGENLGRGAGPFSSRIRCGHARGRPVPRRRPRAGP